MALEKVTAENWKKWRENFAQEQYPVDALVKYRYPMKDCFGKVQEISPSGRIYVVLGELKIVKNEPYGAFWEIDYDPTKFTQKPAYNGTEMLRFSPYFHEDHISWHGTRTAVRCAILQLVVPNKKGLVHDQVLNY